MRRWGGETPCGGRGPQPQRIRSGRVLMWASAKNSARRGTDELGFHFGEAALEDDVVRFITQREGQVETRAVEVVSAKRLQSELEEFAPARRGGVLFRRVCGRVSRGRSNHRGRRG